MAWKDGCDIKVTSSSSFYIQAIVKDAANDVEWSIIGVHLSCSEQVRSAQFQEISVMMEQNQGGIAILGDFNSITTPEEKDGGGDTPLSSMTAFNLFIGDNDLVDLGMIGRQYTWSNRRAGNELIQERLDRVLVNAELLQSFCQPTVLRLAENGSDHAPLLLDTTPWMEK
ncbi:uncharacterized protein [Arachis hypogaea]|uniref:uncharacterized protein n=1 Tax=Arachis hypogaea TaxID=3818 RepID=UPI003B219EBA